MKLIPGDPFIENQNLSKSMIDSLNSYYNLDKPLLNQYLNYLKKFLTLDLGLSLIYEKTSVNQIIKNSFPISMALGLEALFISIFFGFFFGIISAIKKGKWQHSLITLFIIIGVSIPNFLSAALLQYFLAVKLHLFPIARLLSFWHSILPSVSLALLPTAYVAKLMEASMSEVLQKDYIKTAKAKGLSNQKIIFKHVLKNAYLPIISYLAPLTAHILTGSFVIEKIFAIPGISGWLIKSISARDYGLILGLSLFFSFILIVIMFLADIIIALIDPRIQIENGIKKKY